MTTKFVDRTSLYFPSFQQKSQTYGLSFFDVNGDGWLDLYISHHDARPDSFMLSTGAGPGRWTLQELDRHFDQHIAIWSDFDNDGELEMLETVGGNDGTASDPATSSNFLYELVDGQLVVQEDALAWPIRSPPGAPPRRSTSTATATSTCFSARASAATAPIPRPS